MTEGRFSGSKRTFWAQIAKKDQIGSAKKNAKQN